MVEVEDVDGAVVGVVDVEDLVGGDEGRAVAFVFAEAEPFAPLAGESAGGASADEAGFRRDFVFPEELARGRDGVDAAIAGGEVEVAVMVDGRRFQGVAPTEGEGPFAFSGGMDGEQFGILIWRPGGEVDGFVRAENGLAEGELGTVQGPAEVSQGIECGEGDVGTHAEPEGAVRGEERSGAVGRRCGLAPAEGSIATEHDNGAVGFGVIEDEESTIGSEDGRAIHSALRGKAPEFGSVCVDDENEIGTTEAVGLVVQEERKGTGNGGEFALNFPGDAAIAKAEDGLVFRALDGEANDGAVWMEGKILK